MGPGTAEAGTTLTSARTLVAGLFSPKNASVSFAAVATTLMLCGTNCTHCVRVSLKNHARRRASGVIHFRENGGWPQRNMEILRPRRHVEPELEAHRIYLPSNGR